ncbi:hypothetical protein C5167_040721 [Papaver somniferum]|uniref:Glycosyltransferase n=1 Tax=Papaver somniferum TaxID=3469 RepID=A0A4Y7IJ88_PAPSO|nr:UDP-glycosyltransferase 74E2-like [Papaver somniferum]RZC47771.1 hypothetical protein C5167_040721 [Papaver somniferum]
MGEKETPVPLRSLHVLVLPFPAQGHINPMLQFSNRLVSKGVKVTLFTTLHASKSVRTAASSVSVVPFSEGSQDGLEDFNSRNFMQQFKDTVAESLPKLIGKHETSDYPVKCVVYDSLIPWILPLAKELGLIGACFFTQSGSASAIYYQVYKGLLPTPVEGPATLVPGSVTLEPQDLPSFVHKIDSYPDFLTLVLEQFWNVDEADWLLFNTYDKLEEEVVKWMQKQSATKMITVGPSVPSFYLDKRLKDNNDYGLHLFSPDTDTCMKWLDKKEVATVVYVSFGSLNDLGEEQMKELAWGLENCNYHFLWVVKLSVEDKLPKNFVEETAEKGLVVEWCQQLEVMAHKAIGCFITHCGWNSTIEALSLGVPMVAMPLWTDQSTNAKFISDVWGVGVRAEADEKGLVNRENVEEAVKLVMEGDRKEEIKKNAVRWKELAKQAVDEGGSSDKNIDEFVSKILCS